MENGDYTLLAAKMYSNFRDREQLGMAILQMISRQPHKYVHPHDVRVGPEFLKETLDGIDPREAPTIIYIGRFGHDDNGPHYFLAQVANEGEPREELQKKYEEMTEDRLQRALLSTNLRVVPLDEEEQRIVDNWYGDTGRFFP